MLCGISSWCVAQQYLDYNSSCINLTGDSKPNVKVENVSDGVIVTYTFNGAFLTKDSQYNNAYHWNIDGFSENFTLGEPAYLKKIDRFLIPAGMEASISLLNCNTKSFKYELVASKSNGSVYPIRINDTVSSASFCSEYFPTTFGEIMSTDNYRGYNILNVVVYPIRYNICAKTVLACKTLTYKITFTPRCDTRTIDLSLDADTNVIVEELSMRGVLNVPKTNNNSTCSIQDFLILTQTKYKESVEKFASWKRFFGFRTYVECKDKWSEADVKKIVNKYYKDNNIRYLLIVGNYNDVPAASPRTKVKCKVRDSKTGKYNTQLLESINDYTYCCVTGDDADIHRGRISIDNCDDLENIFRKIIKYEKNTIADESFYKHSLHCAFFEDDFDYKNEPSVYGDGQEDGTFLQTSEEIINGLSEYNIEAIRVYSKGKDKHKPLKFNNGNNLPNELQGIEYNIQSENRIFDAIRSGVVYVLYRGHGAYNAWENPYLEVKPSWLKTVKMPVVFSLTCNTGHYGPDKEDCCLAENFLKVSDGGAIGVFASCESSDNLANDAMAKKMIKSLFSEGTTFDCRLGELLDLGLDSVGILYSYDRTYSSIASYTKETFHLFGDPTLRVNTKVPSDFGKISVFNNDGIVTVTIPNGLSGQITLVDDANDDLQSVIGNNGSFKLKNPKSRSAKVCVSGHNMIPQFIDVEYAADEPVLTISTDDFYNKLYINCKMDGQRGTLSIYCHNQYYPVNMNVDKDVDKNEETFTFDTEMWAPNKYFALIQYGEKKVIKYFTLDQLGTAPGLAASVNNSKDFVVKFKFSHGVGEGELKLYQYSDFLKYGPNCATVIETYDIDNRYNGKYTIGTKHLDADNYTIALYEKGRFMIESSIYSPSQLTAYLYENLCSIEVDYHLFDITKNAYLEICPDVRVKNEDSLNNFNLISDDVYTYIQSDIDVGKGKAGTKSFNYRDWKACNYEIALYQDGKKTDSKTINIASLGTIKNVSIGNNSVYITYELGENAQSAYVVITDTKGTFYMNKKIPVADTHYSINGNFRPYKYLSIQLWVNDTPVYEQTYMR